MAHDAGGAGEVRIDVGGIGGHIGEIARGTGIVDQVDVPRRLILIGKFLVNADRLPAESLKKRDW